MSASCAPPTPLATTPVAISQAPDSPSPSSPSWRLFTIAQKILTTGGNLTMVVGNLEKQGLAHRQKSPEDRRVLIVVLTAKGRALIRKLFPEHASGITDFMAVLSPAQQEQLGIFCRQLGRQELPTP
jgi:DNA-binding MarR family transcriptional regulator